MMKIEITKEQYNLLSEYFAEYQSDVTVNLIVCDENLEKLGFCKSAPCYVSLDLDYDRINEILEQLDEFEIEAHYDHTYPKDNFYIQRDKKFGWIYSYLLNAEIQ